jgi:hypothetical protein
MSRLQVSATLAWSSVGITEVYVLGRRGKARLSNGASFKQYVPHSSLVTDCSE